MKLRSPEDTEINTVKYTWMGVIKKSYIEKHHGSEGYYRITYTNTNFKREGHAHSEESQKKWN